MLCRFPGLPEQTRLHCWHRKYYVERMVVRRKFHNISSTQGRRRWSSRWVMWGLVPAGLNISDKSCDFILVFGWRSDLPSVLSPPYFPLTKKGIVFSPLLSTHWPPAKRALYPCSRSIPPASQQTGLLVFTKLLPKWLSLHCMGTSWETSASSKPSFFSPDQTLLSHRHTHQPCSLLRHALTRV